MTLWGGVFSEPTDDDLRKLNDSLPYDKRLAAQDIAGSIAWAHALADAGVLRQNEVALIVGGLEKVNSEIDGGTFAFAPGDEDIHTAVERRLTEVVGEVGGKLHTGRSRNDQVATDFRLWVKDASGHVADSARSLIVELIARAEEHAATLMSGFTHLQPAQPVTVGHWLMSYVWMLARDMRRLDLADDLTSPLGCGALAGTPYPIDRDFLADTLGFTGGAAENSLDAVSDRDFAAEFLFAIALLGVHLSRLAEDLILFSNPAFGYFTLADRYSTGSSLMPQKRNADPMELTRGKAGRLIGSLTGLLATLKGLPTSYNKDLQEDKEAIFDSYDTVIALLPVVAGVIKTMTVHPDKLRAGLAPEMLATDLADYLVKKGMPFRQAHHAAGQAVKLARDNGSAFDRLTVDELRTISPLFGDDVTDVFSYEASVAARNITGGTAPNSVLQQIEKAKTRLGIE